ncbi:FecCD family ABC transporter permease [Gordonia sp. (in: high G+C Gram-positive bacteria)]|uniref:FecCD family ABC transporter permease n=1 Tax=Gordonia sp. (in: high G+C Gram-positive bacteria) TaxID=84139 RepID=UPI003F9BA9FD
MTATTTTASPRARRGGRRAVGAIALVLAILALCFVSIGVGVVSIPPSETVESFFSYDPTNTHHLLAQLQRVPRTILAVVVGVCLGLAGALMQALSRNPLAEPGILGVNAGAACAIAAGIAFLGVTNAWGYVWLGLVGAAVAGVIVIALGGARRGASPVRLVLAGAAVTAVLMALSQLVLLNATSDVYDSYRTWMIGSLAGRDYHVLAAVAGLAVVGVALAASLARSLDSAALGEDAARALGANPTRVWAVAGVSVILLAGSATAAAGPIVFLGLAAPHVARLLVGVSHRWLLTYSALIGALLLIGADVLGRVVSPGHEIGVGIMVAIIGGPFFVWIVRGRTIRAL